MKNLRLGIELLLTGLALGSGCGESDSYIFVDPLNSGTPLPIHFRGDKTILSVETPQGNENYLLVLASTRADGQSRSLQVNIANPSAKAAAGGAAKSAAPESLEPWKAQAKLLASGLSPLPRANFRSDPFPPYYKDFRLLTDFDNPQRYQEIRGKLLALSGSSAFYCDLATPPSILNDPTFPQALAELQNRFDRQILPIDRQYFGEEGDVDGFTPIQVLITPYLNDLGQKYGGRVRGFFYAGDLYPRSESDNPAGNGGEILYLASPDPAEYPAGTDAATVIRRSIAGSMSATLAHEMQHLINFSQRVLLRQSEAEQVWLNEGLSHLAEDLNGFLSANDGRATTYLLHTSEISLTSGQDSLEQRGGSYLLLRYLLNSRGREAAEVTRALVSETAVGAEKLGRIFDSSFSNIIADFSLALWYEDGVNQNRYSLGPRPVASLAGPVTATLTHYRRPEVQALDSGAWPFLPAQINYQHFSAAGQHQVEITFSGEENGELAGYLLRLPDGDAGSLSALAQY